MADVAWSEKRRALIPGKYENGFFVPFNGDDPIPADQVVASKPPIKVKAMNEEGEFKDMSLGDAYRASSRRTDQWLRTKGIWWILGITLALWILSMIGTRGKAPIKASHMETVQPANPTEQAKRPENDLGSMDLSPGLSKTKGMFVAHFEQFGDKNGADCSSDKALVASLERVQRQVYPTSATIAFGVRTVELSDGTAKLIGFERRFAPGDPGVWSIDSDFYLVGGNCGTIAL